MALMHASLPPFLNRLLTRGDVFESTWATKATTMVQQDDSNTAVHYQVPPGCVIPVAHGFEFHFVVADLSYTWCTCALCFDNQTVTAASRHVFILLIIGQVVSRFVEVSTIPLTDFLIKDNLMKISIYTSMEDAYDMCFFMGAGWFGSLRSRD